MDLCTASRSQPAASFAAVKPFDAKARTAPPPGRRPVYFMFGAVGCYMSLPLAIYWGVQATSPPLFTAVSYLLSFGIYTAAIQLAAAIPESGTGESGLKIVRLLSAVEPRYLLSVTALKCDWFLFTAAITLAPAAVVTILFELWPVLYAVLCLSGWWRTRMLDGEDLDRSAAVTTLGFMSVGTAGVTLAVLSDAGSQAWSWAATAGVAMAVLAAAMTASSTSAEQMMGKHQRWNQTLNATHVSAAGNALSKALLGGLMLLGVTLWQLTDGTLEVSWAGLWWATAAAALHTGGTWLFQHANHLAVRNERQNAPQINSLFYLVPVGAVVLLTWLTDSAVARPALLICGLAGVVTVNMVMHLDPEGAGQWAHLAGGHGFKALVLAVWVCGTAVVLRGYWLPARWQAWSVAEYWGMVGVCATVFVLMLSFCQSQLGERRRVMDRLTLR